MKSKNTFTLIIFLIITTLAFSSCNDDGYSLDKFWLEFGTIEKTGDNEYQIVLDKGPVLFPSVSNVPARTLENNTRVPRDLP